MPPPPPDKATCPKCDGCGKIDKQEQKPWSRFAGLHVPEIMTGKIEVAVCPDCKGACVVDLPPPAEASAPSETPAPVEEAPAA